MTNDNGNNVIEFAKRGELGPTEVGILILKALGIYEATLELAKHMILAGDDEE